MAPTPLQGKKMCSDERVHGIQIDSFELMISMQKSGLKNMHRVLRYRPKCVKFCWFGLEGRFWTLFFVISWDSVHIFQKGFLCWNHESMPVNTVNPI